MHGGSQGEPNCPLPRTLVGHAPGEPLVLTHANSMSLSSSKSLIFVAARRIRRRFAVASRGSFCNSKSTQSPSWLPRQEAQTTKAPIVNTPPPSIRKSETDPTDRPKKTNNTSLAGPCPPTANCTYMTPRFFSRAPPQKGDSKSHRRKYVAGLRTR